MRLILSLYVFLLLKSYSYYLNKLKNVIALRFYSTCYI
jgi:hypothetical protein